MSYLQINGIDVDINKLDEAIKDVDIDTIKMKMQNGPRLENGVNGLVLIDLMYLSSRILKKFDKICPCKENEHAFNHLEEAITWQFKRDHDRLQRAVKGTSGK